MPTETRPAGALLTLAQWLSPAFPVGAFSYSHGLEWQVEAGAIRDADAFRDWLCQILAHGAGRTDAILLACAYRAETAEARAAIDGLARALAPSFERGRETLLQGEAFAETTGVIWSLDLPALSYPVAVGTAARHLGLPLGDTLSLYLHSFAGNLTSAAIRLVPLGQTAGQAVLAGIGPLCEQIAAEAAGATPDDLGSCCFMADIASMKHETQYSRLFRS
jgi:urease accessory protein